MFQCSTSSHARLPEPLKSQAALRYVLCVNMLIEKCVLRQLTCNVTLAHIYLPGEGIREDDRMRQRRRRETQRVMERADVEKRETQSESERERGTSRGWGRCQEAVVREGEWWRLMGSGSLGTKQSAKWECKEEKWQGPDVILSKLLHYCKQKEHRGRGERLPCHRLWSLNI